VVPQLLLSADVAARTSEMWRCCMEGGGLGVQEGRESSVVLRDDEISGLGLKLI
jgi:hypothetical protein